MFDCIFEYVGIDEEYEVTEEVGTIDGLISGIELELDGGVELNLTGVVDIVGIGLVDVGDMLVGINVEDASSMEVEFEEDGNSILLSEVPTDGRLDTVDVCSNLVVEKGELEVGYSVDKC